MHLTNMVKTLIENRRFFVELSGKKCRWRRKHSGQTLFNIHGRRSVIDTYSSGGEGVIRKYLRAAHVNIYVNDQPISTLRPGVSSIRRPVYHHHPQSVTHMIGKNVHEFVLVKRPIHDSDDFPKAESTLCEGFTNLSLYYKENHLKANSIKLNLKYAPFI